MARIGLFLYLMLVTAGGPALCFCAVLDLLGLSACPAQAAPAPAKPHPAEAAPCCCCHETPTPPPTPSEAPPQTPLPECPCRQHAEQPVLSLPQSDAARALADQQVFADLLAVALPASLGVVVDGPRPTDAGSELPFLSARDLLRAHHLLRC